MMKLFLTHIMLFFLAYGCDSVHDLSVKNETREETVAVYYTSDDILDSKAPKTVDAKGRILHEALLAPGEELTIGTVNKRYVQEPEDINIEYVEFRYGVDTIVFKGKKAIFTSFHKEGSPHWRYVIK